MGFADKQIEQGFKLQYKSGPDGIRAQQECADHGVTFGNFLKWLVPNKNDSSDDIIRKLFVGIGFFGGGIGVAIPTGLNPPLTAMGAGAGFFVGIVAAEGVIKAKNYVNEKIEASTDPSVRV